MLDEKSGFLRIYAMTLFYYGSVELDYWSRVMSRVSGAAGSDNKTIAAFKAEKQNAEYRSDKTSELDNALAGDTPMDLLRREPTTTQNLVAQEGVFSKFSNTNDSEPGGVDFSGQVGNNFRALTIADFRSIQFDPAGTDGNQVAPLPVGAGDMDN